MEGDMPTKQPPEGYAAVSIAMLAIAAQLKDQPQRYIAERHPTSPGKPLQALSFGSKLYGADDGVIADIKDWLVKELGAHPEGFVGADARFWLPEGGIETAFEVFVDDLWQYIQGVDRDECYLDWGDDELIERLSEPYWAGIDPPLSAAEAARVEVVGQDFVQQPQPQEESERGGRRAKYRFFRLVTLRFVSEPAFHSFLNSRAIYPLLKVDLLTTDGGRRQGRFHKLTLANNLGIGLD
jgi:hypothetical protein